MLTLTGYFRWMDRQTDHYNAQSKAPLNTILAYFAGQNVFETVFYLVDYELFKEYLFYHSQCILTKIFCECFRYLDYFFIQLLLQSVF